MWNFLFTKKAIQKTERQNNISISKFGYENAKPYLHFKTNFWKACWFVAGT